MFNFCSSQQRFCSNFFFCAKKANQNFSQYIIEDYSSKKMKNEKNKSKKNYRANKEKLQKRSREYYKDTSEDEKLCQR